MHWYRKFFIFLASAYENSNAFQMPRRLIFLDASVQSI